MGLHYTHTWELIGKDDGLMWVNTNTPTWELIGANTPTWECIGTDTWIYTNTHTRELNRNRPDQTRPDQTRQTHFKSFQSTSREGLRHVAITYVVKRMVLVQIELFSTFTLSWCRE